MVSIWVPTSSSVRVFAFRGDSGGAVQLSKPWWCSPMRSQSNLSLMPSVDKAKVKNALSLHEKDGFVSAGNDNWNQLKVFLPNGFLNCSLWRKHSKWDFSSKNLNLFWKSFVIHIQLHIEIYLTLILSYINRVTSSWTCKLSPCYTFFQLPFIMLSSCFIRTPHGN